MRRAARPLRQYIVLSFFVFVASIAACVYLAPEGARHNNGISYYDHVGWALIPYVAGVLAIAAFCVLAGRDLPSAEPPWPTLRAVLMRSPRSSC